MFIEANFKGYIQPRPYHQCLHSKGAGQGKRKADPSKEGLLGVEGTDDKLLRSLLTRFFGRVGQCFRRRIRFQRAVSMQTGFRGGTDSEETENWLAKELNCREYDVKSAA
jgi:hypothetical protein